MKICVARQIGATLGSPPNAELQRLTALSDKLGNGYGEFALLNPVVTEMASANYIYPADETPVRRLVADIRLGAARQHCDTVFLYATSANVQRSVNPLTLLDLTLVGMLVVPSHEVNATAQASGLLLDVRTGYPCAQLSGAAKSATLITAQSQGEAARNHADAAQLDALDDMLHKVPDTLEGLRARLNAKT
jgi:hypothetical protein